jgi:hypothetical protein
LDVLYYNRRIRIPSLDGDSVTLLRISDRCADINDGVAGLIIKHDRTS